MTWIIEDNEKEAFINVVNDEFKADVIKHARKKLVFNEEISDEDFEKIASSVYDRYVKFLSRYKDVSYESFVKLMIVYFIVGISVAESNEFLKSLLNDRFNINTRITIAYELSKMKILKA